MSKINFLRTLGLAFAFICFVVCTYAQGSSNQGTEFYTAYIDHIDGAAGSPNALGRGSQMELYITADVNTAVTVEVADGSFSSTYQVKANDILTVDIPPGAFIANQGQFLKGIHITSFKPIAVYAHIFAENVSGATLLLPVNTLGKDYLSINYKQISNSNNGTKTTEGVPSYSTFAVIATEDNTTVEITPSQPLLNGIPANQPFTINLKKGEVYQGLSATDLTGTRIRSIVSATGACKKIAVFSGSSKISIGCQGDKGSSDNLFQQVYPLAVWGKNYITAPLKTRNYDILRIVLSSPDTKVTVNGAAPQGGLINGLYYEFTSTATNVISADKPIQVVQYAVTQGEALNCQLINGDIGDPEMIYLTPIEQTLDHVTLNSTHNYLIQNNFINVIIKTAAVPTFSLDGQPYTQFSQVPNGIYSYAQISVNAGVHNIKASDGFNAIAYGFGRTESYGYAAGTNLKNLNEFIALLNPTDNSTQANGCAETHYKLQLTLPFQTNKITWDFKNGGPPVVMNNPTPTGSIIKDSKVLYTYEYPGDEVYSDGDYSVVATVFNPIADECGSNEDIEFDFNISIPPVVKFSSANNCFGGNVQFTDQSTSGTRQIKTWHWDFGDGTTDVVQNPIHKYAQPGDYLVTLFVTNENGCGGASDPIKIHISQLPVASFSYSSPGCAGQDVTFTDNSTSVEGDIVSWQWDFGDGTPVETLTSKNPFNHAYNTPGDYLVKLTVTNSNGCASNITPVHVNIYPVPVVDFLLPDACEDDFAQFTDQSTIADATATDFTYEWNFDDPNATPGNANISHEKNPKHKFLAGNYQVTLKVTSKYGCSFTSASKSLTINGSNPKAVIVVQDPAGLCSAQEVFFKNQSTVNFGEVTRLEVTYDSSDPSTMVVYDHPTFGMQLRHKYPLFTTGTRQITLRAIVYSGTSCSDVTEVPFTLKASPTATFDQAPVLCIESEPKKLIPNLVGPTGSGLFSGTGVSTDGIFNPAVSGAGVFDIRYIYTATNACADTVVQQVKVDASPLVSLGPDFTMLEGAKHILKPVVNDDNLSYKWTPATGLDHDDVANPVASPAQDITYQVVVTSAHGCQAMATVSVKVLKFLVVPNVFTPNGDGVNDFWNVKYLESYPNNKVDVYNRFGERVYSSIGYSVPWDGRYNGSYLPPGTYYYIIDPKNGREVIAGNVTIIR